MKAKIHFFVEFIIQILHDKLGSNQLKRLIRHCLSEHIILVVIHTDLSIVEVQET